MQVGQGQAAGKIAFGKAAVFQRLCGELQALDQCLQQTPEHDQCEQERKAQLGGGQPEQQCSDIYRQQSVAGDAPTTWLMDCGLHLAAEQPGGGGRQRAGQGR